MLQHDKMKSTFRRKARNIALQVLYEIDASGHDHQKSFDKMVVQVHLHKSVIEFASILTFGVIENLKKIDEIIQSYAYAWPISQIAYVDRNILRIAIFELLHHQETPSKVVINEAIEISKVFGSDNSSKFVNGVLGSVLQLMSEYKKSDKNSIKLEAVDVNST